MKKLVYAVLIAAVCMTGSALYAAETDAPAAPDDALKPLPLTDEDCTKCHYAIALDVDEHGEAHKELACTDCHAEHPPTGTNVIPNCSDCHDPDDNAHFAVENCRSCHNPHHPLLVDFTKAEDVAPACAACHEEQVEELAKYPSAHSEQDCNACHNQHGLEKGQSQTCLDCHEPHSADMDLTACLECHSPHSPTNIVFSDSVPVTLCAACHEEQVESLSSHQTKHSEMACVECHGGRHQNITPCVDCHDQPHNEYMHKKFPECITCHRDPHDLAI